MAHPYTWEEFGRVTVELRPELELHPSWRDRLVETLTFSAPILMLWFIRYYQGRAEIRFAYMLPIALGCGLLISYFKGLLSYAAPVRLTFDKEYLEQSIGKNIKRWPYSELESYDLSPRIIQRDEYLILTIHTRANKQIVMGLDKAMSSKKVESLLAEKGVLPRKAQDA